MSATTNYFTPADRRGAIRRRLPQRRPPSGTLQIRLEIRRVHDAVFSPRAMARDVPVWFIRARLAEAMQWQSRHAAREHGSRPEPEHGAARKSDSE